MTREATGDPVMREAGGAAAAAGMLPLVAGLSRQYCKLCDRRDFDDPELIATIRAILPERDPIAHMERKVWEYAMLALFLREVGRLHERTEALAVGAGDERIVFWLANHLGRMVATDIYGEGEFAGDTAKPSMLDDPAAHAPFPYCEDRLEVRWMDGRHLDFPDESFDVVFSMSSIEHFGSPRDVKRAAREMGRVLRPGGHAFVTSECFVFLHWLNRAGVDFALRLATLGLKRRRATPWRRSVLGEVFTPKELRRRIVRPSRLRLMQPLDLFLSEETWDNVTLTADWGRIVGPRTGEFYPHVLLHTSRAVFTSVALALERPG
jgi:SAM-dependent methyltransferase